MRTLNARSSLNDAKRDLGREVRMLEGFVGLGLGANEIRLYVAGFETPVAKYVQEHYGNHYAGYYIRLLRSSGFRATFPGA